MAERLDTPLEARRRWRWYRQRTKDPDRVGRLSEGVARFLGTPRFVIYLTIFCAAWLGWNTIAPTHLQFDKAALGFTALTLMLSLQASYAAPLILLAQSRQTDRDRVAAEQDRQRAERNLADTEYVARELAALRLAMNDVATRDFVRSEMRGLLEDIVEERDARIRELELELAAMAERRRGEPDHDDGSLQAPPTMGA
ncbi:DUF1003 domain-containing protein [Georgenia thermotolerans]|uniref:DUF1003 domain-containing protein n=1 Tax=Georgenia thermotolerans TaxID=527326 RepID=A0A7J5UIX2_9MICO|nr:DUF1003 domain-containing protein [Georgenia thermotolerans]KAE8762256.1 DUF1003 domain-containing protein [Georgenia thermotolerans]